MKDIDESSAGLSKDFWKGHDDEKPVARKNAPKQYDFAQDPYPMIGRVFYSLSANPREVVVKDVRKGDVLFEPVETDYGVPQILPIGEFLKVYEPGNISEDHQAGPIDSLMDPEDDAGFPPMVIDLGVHRAGNLDESWLTMFGGAVEMLMNGLFGGHSVPVKVRGTPSEVSAFSKALGREKKYLDSIKKYGLDNPRTYKNKGMLDKAIAKFERTTSLKWPFRG